MKALFVPLTHARMTPCHEILLEYQQTLLNEGAEVVVVGCDAELPACDWNPFGSRTRCWSCISRRKRGSRALSPSPRTIGLVNLTDDDLQRIAALRKNFRDLDDLKSYSVDGNDVGMAAASSLITWLRDPELDIRHHNDTCANLVKAGMMVYYSVSNHVKTERPDRIYVFNGRTVGARAVLRAAAHLELPCHTLEAGNDIFHHQEVVGHSFHEKKFLQDQIRVRWEGATGDPGRADKAEAFFKGRVERSKASGWAVFAEDQRRGLLPDTWDQAGRKIAVFNSAEDEFAAVSEEWANPIYPNQLTALRMLQESIDADNRPCHVYVRIHPNLIKSSVELERIATVLTSPKITIIPPDSAVDSYALLNASDVVLTYGSTIGLEAGYWGKPSILAASALWDDFGITYNPGSHEELVEMLFAELPPKPRENALPLGYSFTFPTSPFLHYRPISSSRGVFRGTEIRDPLWMRAVYFLLGRFILTDRVH